MSVQNLSNLEYDWVTILHEKGKAIAAYDKYIEDAKTADSQPCIELFENLKQSDSEHVQKIKEHLMQVMQNGTM
ncbi:MAG TPA: hypothetical protein V6C71_06110 [Coleofasciculaceae cyanobacterium]|jgi:hypothetical protein